MQKYIKLLLLAVGALLAFIFLRPKEYVSSMIPAGAISSARANELAERLYSAFNHMFGTDNAEVEAVYLILKANPQAFRDVARAFGMKRYLIGSESFFMGELLNLQGWLQEELSSSEFERWHANIISKI